MYSRQKPSPSPAALMEVSDMKGYSKGEREIAKMVAEAALEKILDKVQGSVLCQIEAEDVVVQYMRGYEVEVYPDGTCDLIHKSAYEKEGEDPCTDKIGYIINDENAVSEPGWTTFISSKVDIPGSDGYPEDMKMLLRVAYNAAHAARDVMKYQARTFEELDFTKEFDISVHQDGSVKVSVLDEEDDIVTDPDTTAMADEGCQTAIYFLKLKCSNCGHSWNQEIPFGMDFFPFSLGDMHWEAGYGHPQTNTGHRSSIGKERIQCPKCGSYKADKEVKP